MPLFPHRINCREVMLSFFLDCLHNKQYVRAIKGGVDKAETTVYNPSKEKEAFLHVSKHEKTVFRFYGEKKISYYYY